MGRNRTRRWFGRQKKDAWAASQYTLYGFRPRRYHFLSPLFLYFSPWSRKLHFNYAHRYFLDISARWNNPRNIPALDFDWMIGASKWPSVLLHCSILSLLLKKSFARLAKTSWTKNADTKISFYHVQTMIERILRFMTAQKLLQSIASWSSLI